ncbi:ribosomal protein S18-alanine N-acetyltransferase [Thiomicrospira microaerophila]|uniref:ribosomal protein S18-alanine N-acetyltransferase n=1 Tax=Thiomicrospira microaerophila TaxID=406020 RepID=UPI000696D7CA|nr:ribosomal protein S18-alanine N-acetyltransferase [Thiomicrospira microaerophila]
MSRFDCLRLMDETDLDWAVSVEQRVHLVPWSKKGFEQALADSVSFVMQGADNRALGYMILLPVLDELHLLNLAVDSDYQGQGVAKAAMQALIKRFDESDYQTLLLEVRESNKIARHIYQKIGFQQDGMRKNYYQTSTGREHAVLMSLKL